MNALDVLDVHSEVRGVVDLSSSQWIVSTIGDERAHLVLKQDTGHFVPDELRRLILIVTVHQEVVVERASLDGEHQCSSLLETAVSTDLAPHLQSIRGERILTGALLIFTITTFKKALGPRVALIVVESTREWEGIVIAWRSKVPCEAVDEGSVGGLLNPGRIEICNYGGSVKEVAVMTEIVSVVYFVV